MKATKNAQCTHQHPDPEPEPGPEPELPCCIDDYCMGDCWFYGCDCVACVCNATAISPIVDSCNANYLGWADGVCDPAC